MDHHNTMSSTRPARLIAGSGCNPLQVISSPLRPTSLTTAPRRLMPAAICSCINPLTQALHSRVMKRLASMPLELATAQLSRASAVLAVHESEPAPVVPTGPVLLVNIRVFDGVTLTVRDDVDILIEDGMIVDLPPKGLKRGNVALMIDCGARMVIPGLIDAHWHSMFCGLTEIAAMTADVGYVHLVAAQQARQALLRGFTTVRDAGGPVFALKRAIDEGLYPGPRIYASGAMISQTGGHGDFRMRHEVPRTTGAPLSHAEQLGAALVADGEHEVLRRVREQLMLGASQIKIMAGGGVSSHYDPIDTTQYSEKEIRTAVQAARDWGTYVMAHVYTPRGIERAVRAGVQSIEHGQLADRDCARLMADEGVWWSLQPFFGDEDANVKTDPKGIAAQKLVAMGTEQAYQMAIDLRIRTAWGTDMLFTPEHTHTQGRQLAKLVRFYEPLELLQIATARNGELCQLSGLRNPYPGKLGVIAPGALADLLVIDGNPAQSLEFLTNPENSLKLIMKGGVIHKNTLC